MNICQRINEVRKVIEYIKKEKKVQNYKAVTHDQVTAMIRSHLIKHGVLIFQRMIRSETVNTNKQSSSGTPMVRHDADYEFDWVNMDEPTDRILTVFGASAEDYNDKAPGKCASYAMKTNMLKTLNIETGEDDESRLEGTGNGKMSKFEKWEIKATESCEAAQGLNDIIQFWPDNTAAIKKDLSKSDAAKIYNMYVDRKNELKAKELKDAEREPGADG